MKRARREFPGASAYQDRHGVRRWRYRAGAFSAELGRDYGSPDFVRKYEAALRREKDGAQALAHGSISWLIASYYGSPAFKSLGETTRKTYRGVLERFREEHGDKRAALMARRHLVKIMSDRAEKPNAANLLLRLIKLIMDHAIDLGLRDDNPAQHVRKFEVANEGFHTWDEGQVARFEEKHPLGSTARLAFALMLYTGAARADACRLGWQHVRDGRLRYRRKKTERTTAALIDIPLHPELATVLDALPRDRLTFLQTVQGKARSPNGLGNMMRQWCDAAGLPECTSHGLRKACARRLAEAGATPHEIMAVTGHATLEMVTLYTRAASRADMADAAFEKLATGSRKVLANHPERFVKKSSNPLTGKD